MRKAPRLSARGFFDGYNPSMFQRSPFWLGLLLGCLASFGARRLRLPQTRATEPNPLLNLVSDAVVVCDDSGAVTYTNAAARALFGPHGDSLSRLCYPSGQPVPPGQRPLNRVLRTGEAVNGGDYQHVSAEGQARVLDIQARPRPDGGAAVIVRDLTALEESQAREAAFGRREQVLRDLCRRLSVASDAEGLAQALVESAFALAEGLPEARARLYVYDSHAKRLTRLASAPDDRPKRPKSNRQAQPPVFPFDAASPLLWSVYVERQPFLGAEVGDEEAGPAYAVPLLVGGVALGHLSVSCPDADALTDSDLRESMALLASVAALALAGPREAAQATQLGAQGEALREVIQAVADRTEPSALADLIGSQVRRVLGAEVCTLALGGEGGLHLVGESYRDALLFPDRQAPGDPALTEDAARKAMKTGKATQRVGRANPRFDAGVWRPFAGQSGRHSVLVVPLVTEQGALTAYKSGDVPFSESQVKFVETLAALVSSALSQASPTAAPADS